MKIICDHCGQVIHFKKEKRVCEVCKKEYIANHRTQKYCSDRCSRTMYRKKSINKIRERNQKRYEDPVYVEKVRKNAREYYYRTAKLNPIVRIRANLRKHIRSSITHRDKRLNVQVLIGCTGNQLRGHLEKLFKPGMTWDNYGTYWVVDHKHPLSEFDLSKEDHQRMASHYSNLQPLTFDENAQKAARIVDHQPELAVTMSH